MKKLIFTLIIICVSMCVNAQNKFSSVSELLEYLKKSENLFDDFYKEKIKVEDSKFDYKSAYYNDSLKSILLNLLTDSIGWANYYADNYGKRISNDISKDFHNKLIKSYLKSKKKHFVDSIMEDENLRKLYLDSAIRMEVKQEVQSVLVRVMDYIPTSLIDLLGNIRYSEAYPVFLSYYNRNKSTRYYDILLYRYDCPELVGKVNDCLDKRDFDYRSNWRYLTYPKSPAISLLSKAFEITEEVDDGFNGTIPFNLLAFKESIIDYFLFITKDTLKEFEEVEKLVLKVEVCEKNDRQKVSKSILNNITQIRALLSKMYDYYLQQELYWKQNMPYYKQEQNSLNHN